MPLDPSCWKRCVLRQLQVFEVQAYAAKILATLTKHMLVLHESYAGAATETSLTFKARYIYSQEEGGVVADR